MTAFQNNESSVTCQYVLFSIGKDMFGINVMKAQEVVEVESVRYIPDTQTYMKGVIDLRGKIVPIIDLRIKFGYSFKNETGSLIIIITEIHQELIGIIVDLVIDVIEISSIEIQSTPHFTTNKNKDAVTGIGRVESKIILLIDTDKIMSKEEMEGIQLETDKDLEISVEQIEESE